jgi:hypothetical protein
MVDVQYNILNPMRGSHNLMIKLMLPGNAAKAPCVPADSISYFLEILLGKCCVNETLFTSLVSVQL